MTDRRRLKIEENQLGRDWDLFRIVEVLTNILYEALRKKLFMALLEPLKIFDERHHGRKCKAIGEPGFTSRQTRLLSQWISHTISTLLLGIQSFTLFAYQVRYEGGSFSNLCLLKIKCHWRDPKHLKLKTVQLRFM